MKRPPSSFEAEMSVIGAMLQDTDAVDVAMTILSPEDFYDPQHQTMYRHLTGLHANGDAVDVVTLTDSLEDAGELQRAGGHSYLSEMLDAVPTAANIRSHCRIVRDKASLRRLLRTCQKTIQDISEDSEDGAREIIDRAEQRMFEATRESHDGGLESTDDFIWRAMEDLQRWQEADGGVVGTPTGLHDLDRRTSGLHDGELVVLAGRPSHGKTALALNILSNVGIRGKRPVAMFSLEMSNEQLTHRLLSSEARISMQDLRTGSMDQGEYQKVNRAATALKDSPVWMDDKPGATVQEMRAKARRHKARHGLDLLVVDYLQLMDAPGSNRVEQVTALSRGMKLMAKELAVPVLCLSQLSRRVEHRSPPRPILADLRDSGSIEQDADVVLMLWRPEMYMTTEEALENDVHGEAELVVAKQRNGPTGIVKLSWSAESTRFDNLEESDKPWRTP